VGQYAKRLRYQPVVTRTPLPGALHQRIPALLRQHSLEEALDLPLSPTHSRIMVCGNPEMVEDTRKALEGMGLHLSKRGQPGQVAVENSF